MKDPNFSDVDRALEEIAKLRADQRAMIRAQVALYTLAKRDELGYAVNWLENQAASV